MKPVFVKEYSLPAPNMREIFRYARCSEPDEEMNALLSGIIEEYSSCFTGKVCFSEYEISRNGDKIDLGFCTTDSRSLAVNLTGCTSVVLFAATVGHEVDRLTKRLQVISPARSVLLDAFGSERVEALCDCFNDDVKEICTGTHAFCKPRFSPGYEDLPLCVQSDVFKALDPQKHIGISLSDSLLMSPLKSVTALIGTTAKIFSGEIL